MSVGKSGRRCRGGRTVGVHAEGRDGERRVTLDPYAVAIRVATWTRSGKRRVVGSTGSTEFAAASVAARKEFGSDALPTYGATQWLRD